MLRVRFTRFEVHKKYKYREGAELQLPDEEALELEKRGAVEVVKRGPGRPPKQVDENEEFVPFKKATGRKAKWGGKS